MFPSGPFALDFAHRLATHEQRKAETHARHEKLEKQAEAYAARIEDLRSQASADAWSRSSPPGAPADGGRRAGGAPRSTRPISKNTPASTARNGPPQAELDKIAAETATVESALAADQSRLEIEAAELTSAEILRRRTGLTNQLAEVDAEIGSVDAAWSRAPPPSLHDPADRPSERNATEPIALATDRWSARQPAEESGRSFVEQWNRYLAEGIDALLDRLPKLAPVLVGTTAALADNADFAAAVADADFDLIVVDDADGLGEAELSRLCEISRRSLLVGAADPVEATICATRASSFQKLWHLLHPTDARPTYAWSAAEGTVCCTLHRHDPADAAFLEAERLADFPEIELRILARPGQTPKLAQVVFPAAMPLAEVKAFIYRELQEAAVDRLDRPGRWHETDAEFVLQLSDEHAAGCATVELEPGLVESTCSEGSEWTTCRLTFAKTAGWTDERVQEWCRRYLGFVDTGRTADLG